jgi:ATP-dependent DNA helicase RecG
MSKIESLQSQEVCKVLKYQESAYLDFKGSEIAPAKLSRTISGLANSDGGEIYIGISEEKNTKQTLWSGFKNPEAANPIFQTLEKLNPSGEYYKATFLKSDQYVGLVLHLIIFKSRSIIFATNGKPYIRRNAQNLPVEDSETLKKLERDKGIASYEDQTVNIQLEDISNSAMILSFILNVVPTAEPEKWLEKQNLIHDNKPTVSATMLFHDEPQIFLPKRSAIKISRYKSKENEGSRETLVFTPITIEGCAYELIKNSVLKVRQIIEEISILGEQGLEKIHYPDEVLHEIITNSVLHRDYSIAADIQVLIFDNRVEIISPGRLPSYITPKNILNEQYARNPKLVRIINKFPNPPNKDVGEGLNTAFEAMKKHRLKQPIIEEKENSVLVIIKHEPLASPHDIIMEYLNSNADINNRTARELTGITSENSMKRVFYDLRDKRLIEQIPDRKGSASAWRKPVHNKLKPLPKDLFEFADQN